MFEFWSPNQTKPVEKGWFDSPGPLLPLTVVILAYTYLTWPHLAPYFRVFGKYIPRKWLEYFFPGEPQEHSPYAHFVPLNRRALVRKNFERMPAVAANRRKSLTPPRRKSAPPNCSAPCPKDLSEVLVDKDRKPKTPSDKFLSTIKDQMEQWVKNRINDEEVADEITQKHTLKPEDADFEVKTVSLSKLDMNFDLFPRPSRIRPFGLAESSQRVSLTSKPSQKSASSSNSCHLSHSAATMTANVEKELTVGDQMNIAQQWLQRNFNESLADEGKPQHTTESLEPIKPKQMSLKEIEKSELDSSLFPNEPVSFIRAKESLVFPAVKSTPEKEKIELDVADHMSKAVQLLQNTCSEASGDDGIPQSCVESLEPIKQKSVNMNQMDESEFDSSLFPSEPVSFIKAN